MVVYFDPIMCEMEMSDGEMPEGWFIPPLDVSCDVEGEIPPHGTIIACSCEESYKLAIKRKLDFKQKLEI